MADIKARKPRDLSDEKYDEWFTGFVTWFLALPNSPEFCNWLRPGLQALDDTYFAKRIAAMQAYDAQMDASAAWEDLRFAHNASFLLYDRFLHEEMFNGQINSQ